MDKDLDLSSVIEQLMSNENALQMVKQLKAAVGNADDAKQEEAEEKSDAGDVSDGKNSLPDAEGKMDMSQIMTRLAPLIKGSAGKKSGGSRDADKRNKLLAALRPYLSGSRQEAVDRIMSLSKITDLIDFLPRGKD